MARYHINPKTGNPTVCRATVKCPFGDINEDHWNSKEEAREVYEARSAEGTMPKAKRNKAALNRVIREADQEIETLRAREGTLQSEKVKLEKVVKGLKQGSVGLDALMQLSKGDQAKIEQLQDMAKVTKDEYDKAHKRLGEIDAERPKVSKTLNETKAKRDAASSELRQNYPDPKKPTIPAPAPAPRSNTSGNSYRGKGGK